MDKLKPCPFCGGEANLSETEGCDYVIRCSSCTCHMFDDLAWGEEDYDGEKNVVDKWNTRTSNVDLTSLVSDLGEKLSCGTTVAEYLKATKPQLIEDLRVALGDKESGASNWISAKDRLPPKDDKTYPTIVNNNGQITYWLDFALPEPPEGK